MNNWRAYTFFYEPTDLSRALAEQEMIQYSDCNVKIR